MIAGAVLATLTGRFPNVGVMNPALLWRDPFAARLVLDLRLPRVVASILVGSGLAASGFVLQMLFGNPLVEPGLVGVSQGGALGAAVAIVAFAPPLWIVQLAAAIGGALGLVTSFQIARRFRFGGWILRLLLAGIAVSALLSAGVGIVKYLADPLSELPSITFWLLGGLSATSWSLVLQVAPLVLVALVFIWSQRWRLNLLSLEDRVSFSLGTEPQRERLLLLAAATVATASLIALAGIVGWIGLLAPHAARRVSSADASRSLPIAMLIGAGFVLAGDTVARTATVGELPLGVITSLIGAGGFIWLLTRNRVKLVR